MDQPSDYFLSLVFFWVCYFSFQKLVEFVIDIKTRVDPLINTRIM